MGGAHYFVLRRGWANICYIAAFHHQKVPMFTLIYHNLEQDIVHSTSLIQFSVCISQACVA